MRDMEGQLLPSLKHAIDAALHNLREVAADHLRSNEVVQLQAVVIADAGGFEVARVLLDEAIRPLIPAPPVWLLISG